MAPGIIRRVDAGDLMAELARVFVAQDWKAMRALYHPSARILTVTGGPTPLGADEIIAELQRASADFVYSVRPSTMQALDEHAAIVTGQMRRRIAHGGFEDSRHVWLLTVREGLVYRQAVYGTAEDAATAYRSLGVTLGQDDPQ